jgi:hypothetical protein
MTTLHFTQTTTATPEQLLAALTDFGPGRSQVFPNSHDDELKVHDLGADHADVTEGGGGAWERLHYDWSAASARPVGRGSGRGSHTQPTDDRSSARWRSRHATAARTRLGSAACGPDVCARELRSVAGGISSGLVAVRRRPRVRRGDSRRTSRMRVQIGSPRGCPLQCDVPIWALGRHPTRQLQRCQGDPDQPDGEGQLVINRTQALVLGFFALAWAMLVVILAFSHTVREVTLRRMPDTGTPATLGFLAVLLALLVVLGTGDVRQGAGSAGCCSGPRHASRGRVDAIGVVASVEHDEIVAQRD